MMLAGIWLHYWLTATLVTRTATAAAAAAVAATATEPELEKCATSCHCYRQSGIYSVFCVRAGLRAIPNSFDFYPQIFNLSGNEVTYVRNDAFRNAYLARLEILDVSDNGVKRLGGNAFASLANLLEIDLSANQLETIRARVFRNNRFLNTIRLSGNPIKELGERAFPLSVYLKTLDLQGCQLRRIHRYAFFSTPLLETLNLKDNALTSPPPKVLHLTRLRTLQLDGNPLKCDANLWRVLEWMRNRIAAAAAAAAVATAASDAASTVAFNGTWSRSHSPQLLSLPCVFGETQNAVFWDTMEVGNGRNKRAITGTGTGTGHNMYAARRKNVDQPQPTPEASFTNSVQQGDAASDDDCTQHYEYSPTRFLKNRYKPKAIAIDAAVAAAAAAPQPSTNASATAYNSPRFIYSNAVKMAGNYVERPRPSRNVFLSKFHKNVDVPDASTAVQPPRDATRVRYENHQQASTIENQRSQRSYENYPLTNTKSTDDTGQYDSGDDDDDDDDDANFIERNHGIILGAEIVLIVILLLILYQLWKENRKRCDTATVESGINIALNGGVQIKSYDTQISGYKRYSLSDEEYSNIRNTTGRAADEGKCDSESGYLSYHRYNSIEGENATTTTTTNNNDYGSTSSNSGGGGGGGTASCHHNHHHHYVPPPYNGKENDENFKEDASHNHRDHVTNIRKNRRRNSTGNGREGDGYGGGGGGGGGGDATVSRDWRTIPRRTSQCERMKELGSRKK